MVDRIPPRSQVCRDLVDARGEIEAALTGLEQARACLYRILHLPAPRGARADVLCEQASQLLIWVRQLGVDIETDISGGL